MRVPSPALGRRKILIWLIKEIDNRDMPGSAASRLTFYLARIPDGLLQSWIRWAKTFFRQPDLEPRLGVFRRIVRYNPIGYKLFRTQTLFPRWGERG
jgi:hypothetical protein